MTILVFNGEADNLENMLRKWRNKVVQHDRKIVWRTSPYSICWIIWRQRNIMVFEGKLLEMQIWKTTAIFNLWEWTKDKIQNCSESYPDLYAELVARTWEFKIL